MFCVHTRTGIKMSLKESGPLPEKMRSLSFVKYQVERTEYDIVIKMNAIKIRLVIRPSGLH